MFDVHVLSNVKRILVSKPFLYMMNHHHLFSSWIFEFAREKFFLFPPFIVSHSLSLRRILLFTNILFSFHIWTVKPLNFFVLNKENYVLL